MSGDKEAHSAQAQQQEQQEEAPPPRTSAETDLSREERLSQALKELDELIGLDSVKERVKSYTNFLKLQEQRKQAGLTTMPISLHMSFVGNLARGKRLSLGFSVRYSELWEHSTMAML